MTYVPPVFLEHSMTEAQKLTALNALETQYDEGIAYIDAMMHDSDYYTETEMDATFYRNASHPSGRSDTGHGCGVDAATVDGYSLSAIRAQALPPGCITFWCFSENSIPSGWELYESGKGKYMLGGSVAYEEGTTNSTDTVLPEIAAGFTSDGTALSGTQIAKHVHDFTDRTGIIGSDYGQNVSGSGGCYYYATVSRTTTTVDDIANTTSEEHTHECTFTFSGYYDEDNVLHNGYLDLYPHYKALCWVIKL